MVALNSLLKYSNDGGRMWHNIFIPEGSSEIGDLNKLIGHQMKQKNHYYGVRNKSVTTFSGNVNT